MFKTPHMGMPAPYIQMQPSLVRELRGWRGDAAGPGSWGASPAMTLEMGSGWSLPGRDCFLIAVIGAVAGPSLTAKDHFLLPGALARASLSGPFSPTSSRGPFWP